LFDTFQHLRGALLDDEHPGDQPVSVGGDKNRIRLGGGLDARRAVGDVAEDLRVFAVALDNHDLSAVNTQPHGELQFVAPGELAITLFDRVQNGQTGAGRAFGVVVMRLRPAEVGHDSVAEKLGDVAAEAYDLKADGGLIVGDNFAPFLRIQSTRNLG